MGNKLDTGKHEGKTPLGSNKFPSERIALALHLSLFDDMQREMGIYQLAKCKYQCHRYAPCFEDYI